MTVSTTAVFELTRDQIIRRAIQLAGLLEVSQHPSADDIAMVADFMGMELVALQSEGVVVTQIERTTLPLLAATAEYTLPADTLDVQVAYDNVIGTVAATASTTETLVSAINRSQYLALTDKTTEGTPTLAFVERGMVDVKITFWPVPTVGMTFRYSRQRFPRDVDTGDVTLDLARRWQKPLAYAMAHQFALAKNAPLSRVKMLLEEAERHKAIARTSDVEKGHIQMTVGCY